MIPNSFLRNLDLFEVAFGTGYLRQRDHAARTRPESRSHTRVHLACREFRLSGTRISNLSEAGSAHLSWPRDLVRIVEKNSVGD